MQAHGVDDHQAAVVAENLVWNDAAGRHNHGVERLPILMERVRRGVINPRCAPALQPLGQTMARLDGDEGLGQYVGRLAMDYACDLAEAEGIGVVGVRNSNFFGTGAYFVDLAAQRGLIALALSNSFPKVAAHGGALAVLGTNPMAFGAPRRGGRTLMVDMSTSAAAGSTVRERQRSGETPEAGGQVTADGVLLPAAGAKGYGLALMVEILGGVITMAGVSKGVGSMYGDFTRSGDSGHFFLALDVRRWMPMDQYFERIEALAGLLTESGAPGEVRIPGEARWDRQAESRDHGVPVKDAVRSALDALAAGCGRTPPWA
jgi:LDH2 family malate/lactate/ureidoglycolate dehydrogenase